VKKFYGFTVRGGYGVFGKAAVRYFHSLGHHVGVMNKNVFNDAEQKYLHDNAITMHNESEKNYFFNFHDYIIASPGVDISFDYPTYKHKWLTELDLFQQFFSSPIISITGSIGKTSTMHLVQSLLHANNKKIAFGGNIGIPTFDLIHLNQSVDYALLETSSFQLQYCTTFAPKLAIWTNLHPNHLDHHGTQTGYCMAKYMSMAHQSSFDFSLLPLSLRDKIPAPAKGHMRSYFTLEKPTETLYVQLTPNEQVYSLENKNIICYHNNNFTKIFTLDDALCSFSFIENILIVAAASDILKLDNNSLYALPTTTQLPEHRLEKVATINFIEFYNDSKSTTTISTLSAVEKLKK